MKSKLPGIATMSALLVALAVGVMPVWADSVDQRIRSLEAELTQLKAEQERVKTEQIELKKEARAAEEKLPSFEYAPTDGMTITAGDKSWAFNVQYRAHIHMNNWFDSRPHFRGASSEGGFDEIGSGTTNFELAPRRNRLTFVFCWEDCFYEMTHAMDYERSGRIAQARDQELAFHFEQWNPYLPLFSVGLRRGTGASQLGRSSGSDADMEHHFIFGVGNFSGTGSHAGMGLHWDRVPVGSGDASLFLNLATSSGGTHMEFLDSDRKQLRAWAGMRPFSKMKDSKWISGLEFGVGLQGGAVDRFDGLGDGELATHEERGSQVLFAFSDVGSGWSYILIPGVKWRVGPYQLRAQYFTSRTEGRDDDFRGIWGRGFEVSQQVFLWSPKGFFTGSASTPGSLLLGFAFERGDAQCGVPGCSEAHFTSAGASNVQRITILNREIGLWYWVRRGLSIGTWWHYWHASNTPVNTQVAVGCKSNITSAEAGKGSGRGCDWWSANVGMRYDW
jgi:hypothetical protein